MAGAYIKIIIGIILLLGAAYFIYYTIFLHFYDAQQFGRGYGGLVGSIFILILVGKYLIYESIKKIINKD